MHEITSRRIAGNGWENIHVIKGFEAIRSAFPDYLSDESKLTMGPVDLLAFPKDEAELACLLGTLRKEGMTITVAGARTGLVGGCVPDGGALVSLEKMDRVTDIYYDHYAGEWRVRAQPGLLLSDLETMVGSGIFPDLETDENPDLATRVDAFRSAPGQYFYPPDPTEMGASLGGTVATNASGARTYRYGPTRDWIRGIRVMTLEGEILDIPRGKYFSSPGGTFTVTDASGRGRRVKVPAYTMPRTKSTAGFYASSHMDLVDLFIGSEGAFGILTEIEVALLPKSPKCSIVQFAKSDDAALELVRGLREERLFQLDFMEFYSENALSLLREMQKEDPRLVGMPPIPETAGAAVFFELSFDPEEADPDFGALEQTMAACGVSLADSWAGYEPRELVRFKVFRHLLPEKVSEVIARNKKIHPGLHRLSSDLAVPDDRLEDIWALYRDRLDNAGIQWVGFGHVGNNHFHVSAMPKDMDELSRGMEIYKEFARTAVAFGGTVSAEHGIGKIKAKFLGTMYSEDEISQMLAVKKAFDPNLALNPGNIFA